MLLMPKRSTARAIAILTAALLCLLCLFAPRAALAATTIMGGNIINQTWTPAGSPYIVQGDITVPSGAFLNIQAGTEVQFASSDLQGAGLDSNRVEVTIKGSLDSTGTAMSPVVFKAQNGSSKSTWYGIVADPMATLVKITNTTVSHAVNAVLSSAPSNVLQISNSTLSASSYGVYLLEGAPTMVNITLDQNSYAFYATGGSSFTLSDCSILNSSSGGLFHEPTSGNVSASISNCVIRSNASYGVQFSPYNGAAGTAFITSSTIHQNGGYGVYVNAGGGSSSNVTIKNSNITSHSTNGVYRNGNATTTVTITNSNIWSNGTNFVNVAPGNGVFSANPLYVSAPSNLRLTSNSPSRFSNDVGGDIGPLPYVNDATPGLHGTLWTNTTLTLAGSPYAVQGDITVAPNVTLTIDPGVTLNFASSDIMAAYLDTSRAELRVFGSLNATGTAAQKISLTTTSSSKSVWFGVNFLPGAANSALVHVDIDEAVNALLYEATAGTNLIKNTSMSNSSYGVYMVDGTLTFDTVTLNNNSYAFYSSGKAAATLSKALVASSSSGGVFFEPTSGAPAFSIVNSIIRSNASYGLQISPYNGASAAVSMVNSTLNQNGGYGVYVNAGGGSSASADIKNSIITNHSTNGIYRNGNATTNVTVTYSDVWGNGTNYVNVVPGAGCISQNPLFVSPPSDLKLQMGSVCIDAGTSVGAPPNDFMGVIRPLNGDGINQAEFDMGAYEYAPSAFCGDGAVTAGEVCDDGAQNGMYGACKADCSGLGPHCGDSIKNGPEACDDGNMSNIDACLNSCEAATCGDGFIYAGVEQCDDGNLVDGDACLNSCVAAACGDGVTYTGIEQCDDGNASNTDSCVMGCESATCGDGFIYAGVEACDDGNMIDNDACNNQCKSANCGDGVKQANEECDDGNASNTDACLNTCFMAKCGDGFIQAGVEQCDDGNMSDADACIATCEPASCGDGLVYDGVEECDDGNASNTDTCTQSCQAAECGDGFVQAGVEACDDGNTNDGDSCPGTCKLGMCGDGVKQPGEPCDDGNASNTDECLNNCLLASCGDGFVRAGVEECDDGNGASGDGCDPLCKVEGMGAGGGGGMGGGGIGGSGMGGSGMGGGGMGGERPTDGNPVSDSGCGCRTVGENGNAAGALAILAGFAAALGRRRKARSRSASKAASIVGLLAFLLASLLGARAASATNILGGNLLTQTWDPSGNPYIVQGDATIPSGATLTIQPGTIVQFAGSDGQGSGIDTTKVELIVKGSLIVNGTVANPAQFKAQVGSSAGLWYGIVVDPLASSVNITGATIQHAANGIRSNAGLSVLNVYDTSIDTTTYGVYILSGDATLNGLTAFNNSYGVYFTGSGGGSIINSIIRSNSTDGIYSNTSANVAINVTGSTIHANGNDGIEAYSSSSTATVTIKNSNITQNSSRGVYRNTGGFGTINVTTTYSNVWNNPTNYSGTSGGVGTISANPIYVAAPSNLRLTSNSPSRFASDVGTDLGPLGYVNDATPGLYGTLWTNTTLTTAGSPYSVPGDLTVAPGVTLTVHPGVTLNFATSDNMIAYTDTAKAELRILGSIIADGMVASPITFASVGAGAGAWYGVDFLASATNSSITYANIDEAAYAIRYRSTLGSNAIDQVTLTGSTYGAHISDGSPSFDGVTAFNNSYGFYFTGNGGGTINGSIARSNSTDGVYINTSSNVSVIIDGSTIHANGNDGVEAYSSSSTLSVDIKNSNITQNSSRGVYRNTGGFGTVNVTTTYSNVWNNPTNYSGTSGGVGTISANPIYVSAPTNLRLTSNSPSRYAADTGVDLGPLPYISDATPGLYGTLWTNMTLTTAGSPYAVPGDLTIAPGVTLTIQPGVTLNFATTDIMIAYSDTAKAEFRVEGAILANGTSMSPITFTSTGAGAGAWYGVDFLASAANGSLTNAIVNEAAYAIRYRTTSGTNTIAQTTLTGSTYGAHVSEGLPSFDNVTSYNNSYGFYFTGNGGGSIIDSVVRSNSTDGVYINTSSNVSVDITGSTIHANGNDGVEAYSSSSTLSVFIKNSNITQNSSRGIYRNTGGFGTVNVTTTYSNVWNNPTNYSGTSGGFGTISANPIYVSAPTNLRLTSNSPSRFAADTGIDLGPLPYVNDATPGLYGTLWTNTTLTTAGSPYAVPGDLTVAPGVTLTVDPGVTLNFATTDIMIAYADTAKAELRVEGKITANGTAMNPITFTSTGASAGAWYGIDFLGSAAGSSLANAVVNEATYGLRYRSTGAMNTIAYTSFTGSTYGVYSSEGTPTYDAIRSYLNSYGFYFTGNGGGTVTNAIVRSNSTDGIYINTSGSTSVSITNATIHANGNDGIEAYSSSGTLTVSIANSIITSNSSRGVYRNTGGFGTVNVSTNYSDVWNNPTNYSGTNAGMACISANPLFVAPPADLKLMAGSVCIDVGTSAGAPNHDVDGAIRPINGDGLNAAEYDMGAYEYASASFCGDGVVNPGELCDNGNQNGTYGYCKSDCSGLGPYCGDNVKNGPEACDDGNMSNNDACLNTCAAAACGDGYTQTGVEQCDDGNASNTDSCVGMCVMAACGDGYTQTGVEQCDDGNVSNNDGCVGMCVMAACGDGFTQAGVEQCDDGNMNNSDACVGACMMAACGDGYTQTGVEQCDDGNMNNSDGCVGMCKLATCGDGFTLMGVEQCDDGNANNNDACITNCVAAKCGDGYMQTGVEQCDDGNLSNTDTCLNACLTASCGDGFTQAGVEECDDANMVNGDACLNTCKDATCGDGVTYAGVEQCDDGNMVSTDACVPGCLSATCGDGFVQTGVEACDDGNQIDNDACKNDCKVPGCGDGIKAANEQCDDGNLDNTDACLSTCLNASCGDGFVQTGVEQCDDGNADNTDECVETCEPAACGDGFTQDGVEECDDGNSSDSDDCVKDCKAATCGDGYVQTGVEGCDDGNDIDDDACPNSCVSSTCGDGVKQANEPCDDGNLSNLDECLNTCNLASCGDGFVYVGVEDCDDANGVPGDGCAPDCTDEGAGGAGGGGGAGGEGGEGGRGGEGTGGSGGDPVDEGGCGCRTVGGDREGAPAALLGLLAAAAVALRKRPRAQSRRAG